MRVLFPWRKRRNEELNEEIQGHLELAARENMESGLAPRDAQTVARHEFGSIALAEEVTRDMWGGRWFVDLLQDVRYGLRMLRKSPGFAAVAVLTLALGAGANTAIFSVVYAALLRPLPYFQANRLFTLSEARPRVQDPYWETSYPNYQDWTKQSRTFQAMAGFAEDGFVFRGGAEPQQFIASMVTPNFFSTLA